MGARMERAIALRITIVMHDFSGGGTERVAIRLANAWAMSGRQVTIFCGTEDGCLREMVDPAVSVTGPARPCMRSASSRMTLGKSLAAYADHARPDVVFAPGNFHLPVLARFAMSDTSGATTVAKLSNPLTRSSSRIMRQIESAGLRRLTRSLDCLVAMSPALRSEAQQILERDDLALAWEPILIDRVRTPAKPSCSRIVVVGRLEPQKNVSLALDAFAQSRASANAELLILGEGSERAALLRRAQRLGIADRVRMPGHCNDVMAALSRASMLLLTSRYEGYPAVLVEAMAAGVPIVATRCSPAIDELMGGDPQSAIVRADPTSIAAALDALLLDGMNDRTPRPDRLSIARHSVAEAAAAYLKVLDAARAKTVHQQWPAS